MTQVEYPEFYVLISHIVKDSIQFYAKIRETMSEQYIT